MPSNNTVVLIPGKNLYQFEPTINDITDIRAITISDSAVMNTPENSEFIINGGSGAWINNGNFKASTGSVVFTNLDATIAGKTDFNNVTIASGAGLRPLTDNIMRIKGARVSRSGKTPTSLYLAMQYGLKASNYPLIPEDFDRRQLPPALVPHRKKIFGLTISPERLREIRNERRPDSIYSSLANCRNEIHEAEAMMRREGIRWLSTTTKSIEEIATTILQEIKPERLEY